MSKFHLLFTSYLQELTLLILATDMSKHGEIFEEFQERANNFDPNCEKDLTSLKLILIKGKTK